LTPAKQSDNILNVRRRENGTEEAHVRPPHGRSAECGETVKRKNFLTEPKLSDKIVNVRRG
jgi:hypothetical protein